jgi:uncharacterized membrane-anchored protein
MDTTTAIHLKKVPEITSLFWIIKVLTTAMGEILSDYLVTHFDPVVSVIVATIVLIFIFCIQFFAKSYIPWKYWLTASLVAVVGTMVADVMHVVIGIPYIVSTIGFVILLAVVFLSWYKSEKTLSIHSVYTKKRELFYWATIVATFALGTAAGDLTAISLHLGYLLSGVLFTMAIVIPAFIYLRTKKHEILWFWLAYIITRPLGASFADWFGKPVTIGGLGLGDGIVTIVLTIAIIILVTFATFNHKESRREHLLH